VDEQGTDLFEETKKKLQYLTLLRPKQIIHIDSETIALVDKEHLESKLKPDEYRTIQKDDFIFLIQLFDLLNSNLADPDFKSDNLNALLGTSKSQTYRKIKSLTELAPNQLIQEVRLSQSLKSLKKKNKTISEIAYDLGFNTPTYFTRVFKQRFDLTPTHFSQISQNQ
jgi:AraC-like DNA-binding protein